MVGAAELTPIYRKKTPFASNPFESSARKTEPLERERGERAHKRVQPMKEKRKPRSRNHFPPFIFLGNKHHLGL
ncbi:hypothetical protein ACFX13_006045 [Malus domestica]